MYEYFWNLTTIKWYLYDTEEQIQSLDKSNKRAYAIFISLRNEPMSFRGNTTYDLNGNTFLTMSSSIRQSHVCNYAFVQFWLVE